MCRSIEEMLNQVSAEADYRAAKRVREEIAVSVWADGVRDVSKIAKWTRMTAEQVLDVIKANFAEERSETCAGQWKKC